MWVSAWRGLGAYDSAVVSHDPVAKALVPWPWRLALEAAARAPRAARLGFAVANTLTGGLARHLPFRTRGIDDALEEAVLRGARQVVLLGAGLDARAHRLRALGECAVFEVDHPDTQRAKREAVRGMRPLAPDLRYVTVDFARDDLGRALADAGHVAREPSAIVWEGVVMYLEPPAIDATLRVVARIAAPGSSLMVTYQDTTRPPGYQLVRPLFTLAGEPLRTSFEPSAMRALLARHGFDVVTDEGDVEWSRRFFASEPRMVMSERLACARRRAPHESPGAQFIVPLG